MTLLGREMLACIVVCCIDVPARILPLLATGIEEVLKLWGLFVQKKRVVESEDSQTERTFRGVDPDFVQREMVVTVGQSS